MKSPIICLEIFVDPSTNEVQNKIKAHLDLPLDLLIDSITDALHGLHRLNQSKPNLTIKDLPNAKPSTT